MKKWKFLSFLIGFFVLSYGLGLIFHDKYLLGSTTLFLGCFQNLLMVNGKWYEKSVGILETVFNAVVNFVNGLYGTVLLAFFVSLPISIFSLVNWKKNQQNGIVKINKMSTKLSIFVILAITLATIVISFLLSLIPSQNLPTLDTLSIILTISGTLLIALRFKEGWIFWIFSSVINFTKWCVMLTKNLTNNAIMMMICAIVYFALNIWGYVSFLKMRKKQENYNNQEIKA